MKGCLIMLKSTSEYLAKREEENRKQNRVEAIILIGVLILAVILSIRLGEPDMIFLGILFAMPLLVSNYFTEKML